MRKSSRLPVDKRPPSGTINRSGGSSLPKESNAPSGTTGSGKAELIRVKPSKKKPIAGTQDEPTIRQQILETNELRQALHNLGITTKASLQTAVKAKSKRAAGVSKATVDDARLLNKEVEAMRKDINKVLKDFENVLMSLTSGTPPPVSFDLKSSKAALAQINARYVEFRSANTIPAPITAQGQEGNLQEVRGGENPSGGSTEDPSAMQLDDVGGNSVPNGQETGGESGLVVNSKVSKTTRAKPAGRTTAKVRSKRGRGSGDEASSPHKKSKKVVTNLDDSLSDLTSPDESDGTSKTDNKTNSVLLPRNGFIAPMAPQETKPQVILPSMPRPATGVRSAGEDIVVPPTQGKVANDDIEMVNNTAADHVVTCGSTGDHNMSSPPTNPTRDHDGTSSSPTDPPVASNKTAYKMITSSPPTDPTGDHDGTSSPPTDPPAAANKTANKMITKATEQVTRSLENVAAHESMDHPAQKTGEQLAENTADKPDDHTADNAEDQVTDGIAGEGSDHVMDETLDEVTTNWVVDEADDEMTDAASGGAPGAVNKAKETTDNKENPSKDSSDSEGDTSDSEDTSNSKNTSDSEGVSDTSSPDETSTTHKKHGVPAARHNKMRLAGATDVDELLKHIVSQKASTKKEKSEVSSTKEKVKKAQRVTLRMEWEALDKKEKKIKQDEAIAQIRSFLRNPTEYRVQVKTRAMIREVAEFCLPACQTTRQLALHILETKYNNIFCTFHHKLDKGGKVHDRSGGTFGVTGIPFARLVNDKSKKSSSTQNPIKRPPGYLHCGCAEDEALLEFYWWKVAEATSPITDRTEGWLDHRKMDPRTRTLMFGFFTEWTHMEVEDIYTGYPLKYTFDAKMARYNVKIARLQEAKAEEVEEEASRVKREEAKRIEEEEEEAAAAAEKRARREKRKKRHNDM